MKNAAMGTFTVILGIFCSTHLQAAECHLRNIAFVSVVADGRLVVNAELWDLTAGSQAGYLANSTYCNVNESWNGVAPATCQAWFSTAMTAFLANKKIYITANACTPGSGISLENVGYFGLNH